MPLDIETLAREELQAAKAPPLRTRYGDPRTRTALKPKAPQRGASDARTSRTDKLPAKRPAGAYVAPEERPDLVAPYDAIQSPPAGYTFVPVADVRRVQAGKILGGASSAQAQASVSAPVRLPPSPVAERPVERRQRERREKPPRTPRTPRPPRKPRVPRSYVKPPRVPRRPRRPRRPRPPRPPRMRRPRRARSTKGRKIPGICRIQCGGRPGACWNTGVCISGLVPFPLQMGACCFPRTYECQL